MTENTLQFIAFLKLIVVAVFGLLYGSGGISGKWKRRYVGPVVFGLAILGLTLWTQSFDWRYLLSVPLLFGALSLGYGGTNVTSEKIKKRAIAGSAAAFAALPVFVVTSAWTLFALHILVCTAVSVVAGVWNQTSSARTEETLIGAAYVLIPLLTV